MADIADVLSAASLLLAAIALVYGAWSNSIENEIDRTYSVNDATKKKEKEEGRKVQSYKAAPLMAGSWLIFIAFLPRTVAVLCAAFASVLEGNWQYEDVPAIFLLAELFVGGLAVHLTGRFLALGKKLKK